MFATYELLGRFSCVCDVCVFALSNLPWD